MPTKNTTQQQVIESLPAHLRPFVALQNYQQYTARDHAVWRFLLHQLRENLASNAQSTYLEGLERTGISLEAIPRIEDINRCLAKLGWRAVVVDGFLPPAIFMEFQALRVLVIAVNMRSFEHMLYTPAPDIVHESAGHAPFIIDIDYAEFLQRFGELGMRAISNQADMDVYEAIRNLSIVKETATASLEDIKNAQAKLDAAMTQETSLSEAALLARLHWWTVEYGLVGAPQNYAIYGAGLLSSLGESVSCLDDSKVKKLPLTVDAINTGYDITARQPQLFVTESCRHLSQILEEFGRKMACNMGGMAALELAQKAATVCTMETNSGVQISGKLSIIHKDAVGNPTYINTSGATQLAYDDSELGGQGGKHHPHGFGSPLGRLIGFERCLSSYTVDELKRHHIEIGKQAELRYLSGIVVKGSLTALLRKQQKNIVMTFAGCTVTDINGEVLFDPDWGTFDMAVGDSIVSIKGGSADKVNYPLFSAPSNTTTLEQQFDDLDQEQFKLYQRVRDLREKPDQKPILETIQEILNLSSADWLLIFEALELAGLSGANSELQNALRFRLLNLQKESTGDVIELIDYALAREAIPDAISQA